MSFAYGKLQYRMLCTAPYCDHDFGKNNSEGTSHRVAKVLIWGSLNFVPSFKNRSSAHGAVFISDGKALSINSSSI